MKTFPKISELLSSEEINLKELRAILVLFLEESHACIAGDEHYEDPLTYILKLDRIEAAQNFLNLLNDERTDIEGATAKSSSDSRSDETG